MTTTIAKPDYPFTDFKFETLWILAGNLRFGSSMLSNRTLNEFNVFVQRMFFESDSSEYILGNAYNGWITESDDEPERLRRWLVLMIIDYYPEQIEMFKDEIAGMK